LFAESVVSHLIVATADIAATAAITARYLDISEFWPILSR